MKALLIDDSKVQRMAIQRALGSAGYEVITAGDGEAGLRAAHDERPDFIVLDILLPRLSGVDVLRSLRKENDTRAVPVIVLTALSGKNKEKLLSEGANEFLEKGEVLSSKDCNLLISAIHQVVLAAQQSSSIA
jgi:CheY-like chemotaxis protein